MVSDFTARWARKSAAKCCSPRLRLSPARPGRPLKPAWPRLAGHLAAAQPGERGPGSRRTGQLCLVSAARPAAVPTRRSVIQLLLRDLRSSGSTAATSDSRPGLSTHGLSWSGTSRSAGTPRFQQAASVPAEVPTPRAPAPQAFPPADPTS